MSEGNTGNSIKDLRIRVKSLEEEMGDLKAHQAVTQKALDIASQLIGTLENHINHLQRSQNESQTQILLIKQEMKGFMSLFRWMFPSFLALITVVFALVSFLLSGRLVWG